MIKDGVHYKQGLRYLWQLPECDEQAMHRIASKHNISFSIAQTLINRGLCDSEAIEQFLFSPAECVGDPALLQDAERAVDRILYAIRHDEPILIFGDYDVDGITSSALMMICLLPLTKRVNFYLPHRVKDGYGISTKIVERAHKNNYKVIITVDNGIAAFEPARRAKELGLDVIITDHHRPHGPLPDAFAVVNPQRKDCAYPFKLFAGVGVGFKLLSLLYKKLGLTIPTKAYELLLLGTVADVVPLQGENRFWVRHGLYQVNNAESFALKILKKNGNIEKSVITSTDIGFNITPQINALGRLEDPRQGVTFLIGAKQHEVEAVGQLLFDLNQKRKEVEQSIINDIQAQIDSGTININEDTIIIAASAQWPPGVIGLVASRFVGKYGKPTILFHLTPAGIAKGSCRSIPSFNIFNALESCKDIIEQFGGHAQAAGLALKIEHIPQLKHRLESLIKKQLTPFDLVQKLTLDANLALTEVTKKLLADLDHMEPFGHENSSPLFFIDQVTLLQAPQLLKGLHVKCLIFADGIVKPVLFFNRPELYAVLAALGSEQSFSLAARVTPNYWQGRVSIELTGIDIAISEKA